MILYQAKSISQDQKAMTTPAITALLDAHPALLQSRELSFDEKVGYLTACITHPPYHPAIDNGHSAAINARLIRTAMTERQSKQLKTLAAKQISTQTKRQAKPARNIAAEIMHEKEAIIKAARKVASDSRDFITVENLQLHITRLQALERKTQTQ